MNLCLNIVYLLHETELLWQTSVELRASTSSQEVVVDVQSRGTVISPAQDIPDRDNCSWPEFGLTVLKVIRMRRTNLGLLRIIG